MNKLVKAIHLKPGMVLDQWDLDHGDDSTVLSVTEIVRPSMRYNLVVIRMKSGRLLERVTTESKLNVIGVVK